MIHFKKFMFICSILATSGSAFADLCQTFVVKELFVHDGILVITSRDGAIFRQHATNPKEDKVCWRSTDSTSQEKYNLALTSLTTGWPITVCQSSSLQDPANGPYPYTSKLSYMYMSSK